MKDTGLAVREAYYQTLMGNVNVENDGVTVTVPVYDGAPSNVKFPYILLSTQNASGGRMMKDDDCFSTEETILLDIVTGFHGNFGGKKQSDLIANEIFQLVHPRITVDSVEVGTIFVESTTLEEQDGEKKIFRKLLRFRHNIFQ